MLKLTFKNIVILVIKQSFTTVIQTGIWRTLTYLLWQWISYFLQDGNGFINRQELRFVMMNLGEEMPEEVSLYKHPGRSWVWISARHRVITIVIKMVPAAAISGARYKNWSLRFFIVNFSSLFDEMILLLNNLMIFEY